MKKFFLLPLLPLLFLVYTGYGQENDRIFTDALELYNQEEYLKAAELFKTGTTPRALLFAGKSYYAAAKYMKSQPYLARLLNNEESNIARDARYTFALLHAQLSNFGPALDLLYQLKNTEGTLAGQANTVYRQILGYLAPGQRKEAFQHTNIGEVKFDLIESAMPLVKYNEAKQLYKIMQESVNPEDIPSVKLERLKSSLSDSLRFRNHYPRQTYPEAPDGLSYNIGVILPKFKPGTDEFEISRNLYLGFLLAAEQFNQRNSNRKVFLHYENSIAPENNSGIALSKFVWNNEIDIVLGPLISESVLEMDRLSELYQIPVIAPLANADTLHDDNPYLFQINPTFGVRGRRMAEYAVNQLGLDTLGVIAERNSLGAKSAYEFRSRAEELGAFVPYLFVDNLEAKGYDLSDYSNYFTTDTTLIDSLNIIPVDGVYAPFTGDGAPVLIDLFLTDLQSHQNYLTILGSAEWSMTQMNRERLENFDMYHSRGFQMDSSRVDVKKFIFDYKNRFDFSPDRFSLIGFDTANLVLKVLEMVQNPVYLKEGLKTYPPYNGLSTKIHFNNTHVNQYIDVVKMEGKEE